MKKILNGILNFFKMIFLTLASPFIKNKEESKEEVTIKSEKIQTIKKEKKENKFIDPAVLPDDDNMKSNPHNEESDIGETESTRIYSLPQDLNRMLKVNEKYSYLAFSDEEIDELVNDELEDYYKEEDFKVYKANSILKKKIDKFKKEVVPIIKDKIYYNNIVDKKKLKKEIKEIVAKELEINPLLPKKEVHIDIEPYSIAIPRKKDLDLKDNVQKLDNTLVLADNQDKETINEKFDNTSMMMVPNTEVIPEPTIKSELPKVGAAIAITAAKEVVEIVSAPFDLPKLKEEPKKDVKVEAEEPIEETKDIEETQPEIIEEEIEEIVLESSAITEHVSEEIKKIEETIKEQETREEQIDEVIQEEQEVKEEKKQEEKKEDKPDEIKEVKEITTKPSITSLENETYDVISSAKEESNKHDFFEKDYDKEEKRIDKMLDKISDTRIKYGKKLTKEQKEKLDKQENNLRNAKDKLLEAKERDISFEKKELDSSIKDVEINGLQHEIENMHLEYDMEANNNVLKKMDKLEGKTKKQVADIDKKIMMKRFNKASFLLEMTSLLALPFVRNKYFNYFTIGLIVDNHLSLTHAWLNRRTNKYQPVNLDEIKKGQDALNGAIDLAYKDLVELDYIEEQAYSRYPELAKDPAYQASITRMRNNLNNQYNKLMKKQNTMEKYLNKGKRQRKVLERID